MSVSALHDFIGFTIGALLNMSVMFLGFTSLGGAFFSGCPFRSPFSVIMRFIFKTFLKRILCRSEKIHALLILAGLWGVLGSVVGYYSTYTTGIWSSLFFFPAAIPIAYFAQRNVVHKHQKHKIFHLALWMFTPIVLLMGVTSMIFFRGGVAPTVLYLVGILVFVFTFWMFLKMSKSTADTGESTP